MPSDTGTDSWAGFELVPVLRGLGLVGLFVLALLGGALAHTLPEHRRLILSLAPGEIALLVAFEVPAGALASELRAMIDLDGNGAVSGELEELARAQVLIPRLSEGIRVSAAEGLIEMELVDVTWRDGAGDGPRRGFEGMALYRGELPVEPGETRTVSLSIDEGVAAVHAEIQVLPGLTLLDTDLPVAPDASVVGPLELQPGTPVTVRVRRNEVTAPGP